VNAVVTPIGRVELPEVVIRFPDLFTATQINNEGEFKFRANFVFSPNSKAFKIAEAAHLAVATDKWKGNAANVIRSLSKDKNSLRNGDDQLAKDGSIRNGYEGMKFVAATSKTAPLVVAASRIDPNTGRLKIYLTERDKDDQAIYDCAIVNAKVEFYAMEKEKIGKGIFCTLRGVQFVRDGKNFSGSRPAALDEFAALATEDDPLG